MKLQHKLFPWFIKKPTLSRFEKQTRRFKEKCPQFSIGRGSYGVPQAHDWNEGSTLKISSFCSISAYVQIYLGDEHRIDWVTTSPLNVMFENKQITDHGRSKGDVNIGNDVWICGNAIILSGVTIGDGAVIGNGAVVSRDVEPYSIVAGNPAKHIKFRFSADIISELLKIKWWDWPENILRENIQQLLTSDIEGFIQFTKEINKEQLKQRSHD